MAIVILHSCLSYAMALTPERVADLAKPATVGIYAAAADDKYYGTGVVISPQGIILTSTTVVPDNADTITIYFEDHTSYSAEIVEYSASVQSILLRINGHDTQNFPYIKLNAEIPPLAAPVYTLGNANNSIKLGDGATFSAGVISGIYNINIEPTAAGLPHFIQVIETDAAVNDGQDGGGLINANAEVIGIISKDFSRQRWQGTAIPAQKIISEFKYFSEHTVPITKQSPSLTTPENFKNINSITDALVGINVKRAYPPEKLIFPDWETFKKTLTSWPELNANEKRRIIVDFFSTESLVAANQMLRRPAGAVTGLMISPDGYIITSSFNVESADTVYIDKVSGNYKELTYHGNMEEYVNKSHIDIEKVNNRVTEINIYLADGSEVPGSIIGFSTPLGLALLKAEVTEPQPYIDLQRNAATPILAEKIAIIGSNQPSYTINTGIVSASTRNNGNYFQVDALLNYGNSGGPIINHSGKFLGLAARPLTPSPVSGSILPFSNDKNNTSNTLVPTLKIFTSTPNSGISMGIMSNKIIAALPELKQGNGINESNKIQLGLLASRNDPYSSDVAVGRVVKDSPAAKAGFKEGDIIRKMDGLGVRSWSEINNYITEKSPGTVVIFNITRPLEKPFVLLNGKRISNAADLTDFIKNNKDGTTVSGHISSPGIDQKLYVTLN